MTPAPRLNDTHLQLHYHFSPITTKPSWMVNQYAQTLDSGDDDATTSKFSGKHFCNVVCVVTTKLGRILEQHELALASR